MRKIPLKTLGVNHIKTIQDDLNRRIAAKEITTEQAKVVGEAQINALSREQRVRIDYREQIINILDMPPLGRGFSGIEAVKIRTIIQKIYDAKGDCVLLEDADYDLVAQRVRDFEGWGTSYFVPEFLDDIAKAERVE